MNASNAVCVCLPEQNDELFFVFVALCASELRPFSRTIRANGFLHALQIHIASLTKVFLNYAEKQATSTKHAHHKEVEGSIEWGPGDQTDTDEQGPDKTTAIG